MKLYGFWYSHVGWIVGPDYKETDFKTMGDFVKYPELVWLNRFDLVVPSVAIKYESTRYVNGSGITAITADVYPPGKTGQEIGALVAFMPPS